MLTLSTGESGRKRRTAATDCRIDYPGYPGIGSSLTARVAAVLVALTSALVLSSCGPASDGRSHPTDTDKPVVTGEPAGYNAGDVAFAGNMVAQDQQGIDMSALVPDRSTNPKVVTFASNSASVRNSDIAVLKVLLVQWRENPDIKTGSDGHGATMKGMVDQATMARLHSLHGSEFDTVWLQSRIGLDQGAVEMASAEIGNGKNVDAVDVAKQIVDARQAEIGQIKQMLAS